MPPSVKHPPVPDRRVERWREHRAQRRSDLVDAALVALERHGPETNLAQIAAVAGIPKPKIYRHFKDRADLVAAVADRIRDLVVERLDAQLAPGITVRTHLERCLSAYFTLVADHPHAMTMLATSAPAERGRSSPLTESARMLAGLISSVTVADLARLRVPTKTVEPLTHALVGAVLGTTDWWLQQPAASRVSVEELVDSLAGVILGAGDAAFRSVGVVTDPDATIVSDTRLHAARGDMA